MIKVTIGQDSHRFIAGKTLVMAGMTIPGHAGFDANSDGDVILHALTNAISGLTGRNILGKVADALCKQGQTDSRVYLAEALNDLAMTDYTISHLSFSLEGKTPKFEPLIDGLKHSLAEILDIKAGQIGITATSGEGLTDFGRGLGLQCFCVATFSRKS